MSETLPAGLAPGYLLPLILAALLLAWLLVVYRRRQKGARG